MTKPRVALVAGPNGAGKSTTAAVLLSDTVPLRNYINPDLIARGLAPSDPASVSFAAGRIVHERIRELMVLKHNFAFETTLSGRAYAALLPELSDAGFRIDLVFLWLNHPDLAVERVATRVRGGGHNIPEEVVRRRYDAGIKNFFQLYRTLVDGWQLYDNSVNFRPKLIAVENNGLVDVKNLDVWQHLETLYGPKP